MKAKIYTMYKSENVYKERSYMAGKEEGIREVVEWINDTDILVMLSPRKRREWQAKLKEWDIEL